MIPPSSIILGCAAQPEFEREVTDYCSTNRIDLYKMEKDPITYCLNKKVVSKFGEEYQVNATTLQKSWYEHCCYMNG